MKYIVRVQESPPAWVKQCVNRLRLTKDKAEAKRYNVLNSAKGAITRTAKFMPMAFYATIEEVAE